MKPVAFTIVIPKPKRRARELYDAETPFRPRVERNRTVYTRRAKHPHREQDQ